MIMFFANDIYDSDLWPQGLLLGSAIVRVGDYIGKYADDADETTGYPVLLADGCSSINDDQDGNELDATLRELGFGVEIDETGLVLVQTNNSDIQFPESAF